MGRVSDAACIPDKAALQRFRFVHVRVPQDRADLARHYEDLGFRYVALDVALTMLPKQLERPAPLPAAVRLRRLAKQPPDFAIEGFELEGSRLHMDHEIRSMMPPGFWDDMIRNHCSDFADFTICCLDRRNRLVGVVSCFNREYALELFLVLVHPEFRGQGIGRAMLDEGSSVAHDAGKRLATNVVSANVRAFNFYADYGFRMDGANIVMHYSQAAS
jgi:GNAT superfamily N-acetyltransferase